MNAAFLVQTITSQRFGGLSGVALQRWEENAPNFRIAPYRELTGALKLAISCEDEAAMA